MRWLLRILSDNSDHSARPFLHAPAMRRIGKSMTIKMLAAMAGGDRELFQGMAVNESRSPFEIVKSTYSVIQMSFSGCSEFKMSLEDVRALICWKLSQHALVHHWISIPMTWKYPLGLISVDSSSVLRVWWPRYISEKIVVYTGIEFNRSKGVRKQEMKSMN